MFSHHRCLRSSANLPEFSRNVKILVSMEDDESDGDRLLDAARRLAGAFSALLTAAQPENQEVSVAVLQPAARSLLPSSTTHSCSTIMFLLFLFFCLPLRRRAERL